MDGRRFPHCLVIARTLVAVLGVAVAGACGSSASNAVPRPTLANASNARTSWALPEAASDANLLYVSSYDDNTVTMYAYIDGKPVKAVGSIALGEPAGMCADPAGNVWIASYSERTIVEYAHGGTTPIRSYKQIGAIPFACAIDPTSGDVAITEEHPDTKIGPFSRVVVLAKGQRPRTLDAGGVYPISFAAYDNDGNLFFDGVACYSSYCSGPATQLYEAPAGSNVVEQLTVSGASMPYPTGLVWIKPTLLLTDSDPATNRVIAYKLIVRSGTATVVATLPLAGSESVNGDWVRAGTIIAPDETGNVIRSYSASNGKLQSTFSQGVSAPFATVVSQKK